MTDSMNGNRVNQDVINNDDIIDKAIKDLDNEESDKFLNKLIQEVKPND